MPPRFRRSPQMATFELVPDDERDDGERDGEALPDDDGGAVARRAAVLRDRAAERWRGLSRRGRAVVAGGTAVVLLGVAAAAAGQPLLDARAERLRAEAVQGLPGAVGDLSEPLTETWELPAGDTVGATMPGGVVLTTQGADAVAIDGGTGREAWRREVGPDPACGTHDFFARSPGPPVDVAVCLTGDMDDRTVVVLDADGAVVGERAIGAVRSGPFIDPGGAGAPVAVPTAAGALAVVEGVTDATAPWPDDGMPDAGTLRALRADGWTDPTLRIEDALTGDVRGEATVHLAVEHLAACGMTQGRARPELMTSPSVDASSASVTLSVCGASVTLTPGGEVVDAGADGSWPISLPGGGTVVVGARSAVLDEDGSLVTTVPGWLIPPLVDTDPDGPYLVLAGEGESIDTVRLTSIGPGGDEEWSLPSATFGGVLARVAGTVVVQGVSGLVGLDAATGAERWTRTDLLDTQDDGSGEWVAGAVTDGTRLLLGVTSGARHRLVALDVRDGATAWERAGGEYLEGVQSIGGHVVVFDDTVHGFG